jgi:hypothetical protein
MGRGIWVNSVGRWWITHGPGSPGSVAKSMARAYSRIRAMYSKASKDELLMMTLCSRYAVVRKIDDITANQMVKDSEGRLAKLTLHVIRREIPTATSAMLNAPDVYLEMLDVIEEVTAKFAPGA